MSEPSETEAQTDAQPRTAARPDSESATRPTTPSFEPFDPSADLEPWSTETFSVEAGQERYLCYAKTLEEDLVINGYSVPRQPFVHHLIFARANAPEPEGFAECDIAFRNSWETLFISGAGNSVLALPDDAGHQLKKGTQLIVQMHLLNAAEDEVEGAVTIDMRRSELTDPRPVSSFVFGTAAVKLPPREETTIVGTCSMRQRIQLLAGFPHMHLLGTSMRFEVGASANELKQVFQRDPFDFNDQRIDKLELDLSPGDVARVTCTFENSKDQEVTYGESTLNEMCYFVGFAIDLPRQSGCLEVAPPRE